MVRGYMIINMILIAIPSAFWIASIQLEYPNQLPLIWIAIFFDLFAVMIFIQIKKWTESEHPNFAEHAKWFEFFPAINIEHKTERTNAFVTLVFGYSVVALLFQSNTPYGMSSEIGTLTAY